MIIDIILERKASPEQWNAEGSYATCQNLYKFAVECGQFKLAAAMDGGTDEDVVHQLEQYIRANEYDPELIDYIATENWVKE